MKNVMNRMLALMSVVAGLAALSVQAQTTTIHQEWRFNTDANPALPETAPSGGAVATALVQQGEFASGWLAQDAVLGSSSGVWDLGRNGTVTLTNWSVLSGAASGQRELTIQVAQWNDGGIYVDYATVVVPGARQASRKQIRSQSGSMGDWVVDETKWVIDAGVTVDTVVITSPYYGGLIDKVAMDLTVPAAPPALTIANVAGNASVVEVSWPADATGWVLETATDVSSPEGWQVVDAAAQTVGTRSVVTVQSEGTRFFRLKK